MKSGPVAVPYEKIVGAMGGRTIRSAPNFSDPDRLALAEPAWSTEVENKRLTSTATEIVTAAVLNIVLLKSLTMRRVSLKRVVRCDSCSVLRVQPRVVFPTLHFFGREHASCSLAAVKRQNYVGALLKVGVVGIGTIGSRVAARLADAGSLHLVYNRTHSKAEVFASAHGARGAASAPELAKACDVIITVLSDDDAVRETFGAFSEVEVRGKTFLEMSTITPSVSASLSSELKKRGASMLDVPVVGSAPMVERGEAVLLVGGDRAEYERLSPLLYKISKEVLYVGQNGSGLRLKLVHNLVLGSYVVALGEAVQFGLEGGLEPALIEKLLVSLSSVRSPNSAIKVPKILNSDYSPQFSLKHMIKDLGIIGTEARLQGSAIPLGATALQLYTLAKKRGFSDEDFSVVAELFRREVPGKRG